MIEAYEYTQEAIGCPNTLIKVLSLGFLRLNDVTVSTKDFYPYTSPEEYAWRTGEVFSGNVGSKLQIGLHLWGFNRPKDEESDTNQS